MSFKEISNTSMKSIIAVIVLLCGFYALLFKSAEVDVKIGVFGLMNIIVGYYFGSSQASAKKDETIADQLTKQN